MTLGNAKPRIPDGKPKIGALNEAEQSLELLSLLCGCNIIIDPSSVTRVELWRARTRPSPRVQTGCVLGVAVTTVQR